MSYLTSNPILAMADGKKGNFTNRMNYAAELGKANLVGGLQTAAISAGTLAAGAAALKIPKVAQFILKGWHKAAAKFPKVAKVINSLPLKVKVLAPVAMTGLILTGIVLDRLSFKKGQIDQKYNDIAKLREKFAI